MKRKLIAGNWKMHFFKTDGYLLVEEITAQTHGHELPFDLVVFPPMNILPLVAETPCDSLYFGSQDVAVTPDEFGAHTGDVSASMVKDLGVTYTLVGHSERRANHHETNEIVRQKAVNAINAGLKTIICIGETLQERESGKAIDTVLEQVRQSLPDNATPDNCAIAYEPVWAIGTGKVASVDDIAQMHLAIRQELASIFTPQSAEDMRIVYGGSVKPTNAREILSIDNVDGALIGGASLTRDDFLGIAQSQI